MGWVGASVYLASVQVSSTALCVAAAIVQTDAQFPLTQTTNQTQPKSTRARPAYNPRSNLVRHYLTCAP